MILCFIHNSEGKEAMQEFFAPALNGKELTQRDDSTLDELVTRCRTELQPDLGPAPNCL